MPSRVRHAWPTAVMDDVDVQVPRVASGALAVVRSMRAAVAVRAESRALVARDPPEAWVASSTATVTARSIGRSRSPSGSVVV